MNKCEKLTAIDVRVDFTRHGEIIPLGITDASGKTCIIDKVEKIIPVQLQKNLIEMQFYCKSNEAYFWLYLIDRKWYK